MRERKLLVPIFMVLLLISTGVHGSCPIELSPPRVVVKYGDPVSINCSTPGLKGIGWESSQGGTGLEQVSTLLWTVDSLKEWDNEPMCYYNSVDYDCLKRPEIVLYTFPETISIRSSSESDGALKEGQQHNFTCHIHNIAPVENLTITWYKGDAVIQTETVNRDDKKPTNQSSVFSFTPAKEDNSATFRCGAYMDLGPEGPQFNVSSPEYRIQVLYGPVFICPSTYTVQEYSRQNLICSQGFPEPQEIWSKDDEEVELPEVLTRREAGQYWVTASNVLSVVNFTVDIIVLYPPLEIYELEDAMVKAGASAGLKCSSVSFPRPKYSWSYHQVSNVIETTEDGVSHLHIENATEYNTGHYTCHAWNEMGNVTKTVRVTVTDPPSEIHELEDAEVNAGASITLKCSSAGVPRPTYSWSYYKVANVIETTEDGVSRLHIENATKYNMGSYSCHASNEIGNVSKTVRVTVKETQGRIFFQAPDSSKVTLKDGGRDNVTLQCDIINVAPAQNLTVQWTWINGTEDGILEGSSKSCTLSAVRSPVNVSCTISISLKGFGNGTEFRCESQLDLRPMGRLIKNDFSSTIIYEPRINTTLLQEKIPVIRDYNETLICEASGNPPPEIEWSFTSKSARLNNGVLVVSDAGLYNCTAKNAIKSVVHTVKVVLKEDYLPLIAGFVAVTVVAISIVFLFIFSIYYKNTKMRRYSLKNPKLGNHNGNVAHNGWDTQFPMTKLS